MKRRDFIKTTGIGGASLVMTSGSKMSLLQDRISSVTVNPVPVFELSPWLYMQFMEPLGVTDSSVEAAWDHQTGNWREDVVGVTKELAPGMIRWGGIFSSYYRWKEAVGPRELRKPMLNITWNGIESNQIGTAEFVDFCRRTGADPLMAVNFESEGFPGYAVTKKGDIRSAGANEAAEWVDYCNNPSNKLRIKHGFKDPLTIKTWQIGNETSYGKGKFDNETAARKTVEFSKAMKSADPSIKIIGWGDSGWSKKMIEIAGGNIDLIAFHHMFNPGQDIKNSPLRDNEYRKDPAGTWEILMDAYKIHESKINGIRSEVSSYKMPLALTECHYAIPGRNRCEVLSSWAAGVSYARMMNLHERNGDLLKIATLADFCGTRWQVNAVMIPVPSGKAFMMPVAKIMALYRKHSGKESLGVTGTHENLDITASRTGNTIFMHVVNTSRVKSAETTIRISNLAIKSGRAFELSADPEFEILSAANDPLLPKEKILNINEPVIFPPASVTALELTAE
jgi:alpha-L-arabinofuranosidase